MDINTRLDGFIVHPLDAFNDHRIAMSAAIAATVCESPVTIRGAEAVSKSYPGFWEDFKSLGANII